MLDIAVVSDIPCPWCAIGWHALRRALPALPPEAAPRIRFAPFELNPGMSAGGISVFDYIQARSGMSVAQIEASWEPIVARAEAVGYPMRIDARSRVHDTFDAHRLIAWAEEQDKAQTVHQALFDAHFITRRDYGAQPVLAEIAAEAGLDGAEAAAMLASDLYRDHVRTAQDSARRRGVNSVPTLIVNDAYQLSGSRAPEDYAEALRRIAMESAA